MTRLVAFRLLTILNVTRSYNRNETRQNARGITLLKGDMAKENFIRWERGKRGTARAKNVTQDLFELFCLLLNFQRGGKTSRARFEMEP